MPENWDTKSLEPDAFELHREQPWEMVWVREDPFNPESDMIYIKRQVKKVIGVRSTGVTRRAGSTSAKLTGLAGISFTCPVCTKTHSPVQPC